MPLIETVQDRVTLEVYRGCVRGCRFCQAGFISRPVREKSVPVLCDLARATVENTGYDEISLMSLSISDYTDIASLTDALLQWTNDRQINLSLPSLRAVSFTKELMEKISESTKATIDFFGKHTAYVNVMRNMSVSCDCEGVAAAPVVTPNVGILASNDICAVDTACVDLIHAMTKEQHHDLWERMQSRHGFRQLSYMKELGMGNDRYILIDLDNDEVRITAKEAVKDVKPFKLIK